MLKKRFPKIKNKKILITGGAGFIGSYLCESLYKDNEVTVFDNYRRNALQYSTLSNKSLVRLATGDVLSEKAVTDIIKSQEIVIHLAAIAGVSSYYENPLKTLEVDALGTYTVLNCAAKAKIQQVLLFSTSEVYGRLANNVTEESPTIQGPATDSRWSYAVGKLIGDHFAYAFSKMKNLPVTIVRPFNIYGPRQIGEGAIQQFIAAAIANQPLIVRGDGRSIRAWCYIDDFIDAITAMIGQKRALNQIFNIGNPKAVITVDDLAKQIIHITHTKSKIEYITSSMTDIKERVPNINKAKKLINFVPTTSLLTGLNATVNWYKQHIV